MAAPGRMPEHGAGVEASRGPQDLEIRSLVPARPFERIAPCLGDDTRVLFVVEGPKAVAVRQNVSVRTVVLRAILSAP